MLRNLLVVAAPLGAGLVLLGYVLDGRATLGQTALWLGLQLASLGGAGAGLAAVSARARSGRERALLVLATFFAWRVSYFPVMVFSGHVASIGEWTLAAAGLPVFVYPTFLLAVGVLHAVAASLGSLLVVATKPTLRFAAAGAFLLAACVSFAKPDDLLPIPDLQWTLDGAPIPPMRGERGNPYRGAVTAPGYWPHQRVVLVAAALTYDTIPPSPWATTVKAVLEDLFRARPHASTAERVREHYLAYHSAHPLIGCRRLEDCAAFEPVPR